MRRAAFLVSSSTLLSLGALACEPRADEPTARAEDLLFVPRATLLAEAPAAGDELGAAIAIDGAWAAVGAPSAETDGRVYLFQRDGTAWIPRGALLDSDGRPHGFGAALAMSGDTLVVGAAASDSPASSSAGQVSVFRQAAGGSWELEQEIPNPADASTELFGWSVAISGDLLVVGAPGDREFATSGGAVHVYERAGTTWARTATLSSSTMSNGDALGTGVATDGTRIVAGADHDDDGVLQYDGSVFVYVRGGGGWTEQAHLRATERNNDDYLGSAVAIAGDTIVAGAPGADVNTTNPFASEARGFVYLFENPGSGWAQTQRLRPASDAEWTLYADFGGALASTRNLLVVGAEGARFGGLSASGAVYLFERGPTGFVQTAVVGGATRDDAHGDSVAIDLVGTTARVAVGASGAGTPRTAGAAHVYDLSDPLPLGAACTDGTACLSGQCIDGVCCDTACGAGATGDCLACSRAAGAAMDGACGPVTDTTYTCRPAGGGCDRAEQCDGASTTCPADVLESAGAVCRASLGDCDPEEVCDGESGVCPANDVRPDGARCDNGASCDGAMDACDTGLCLGTLPASCDDGDACTADSCTDDGGCGHTPIAGCGADAGSSDDAGTTTNDAGAPRPDAGTSADAGAGDDAASAPIDAARADAGSGGGGGGGCSCRVGARSGRGASLALAALACLALGRSAARRSRRRCRS